MVRLISITKPVASELQHMNAEELTTYIARVSSPNNQLNIDTAPKLLKYCIKNAHWSVLEHSFMTVEIETTIPISAQILRHRSFYFQQFSARYSKVNNFEVVEARSQDLKNRQNSNDDMSDTDKDWFKEAQESIISHSNILYNEALNRGIAKEQARFLLPLNTQTKMYVSGNLRSFVHYVNVRCDKSTQKEHRVIAEQIKDIIKVEYPNVAEALGW